MASQFFTVKGMRPKYNYVDAINAQTPFLPERYRIGQERKQAEKEFKANQDYIDATLKLEEKGLKQQKKDARLANLIGIGDLGLKGYMAYQAGKDKSPGALAKASPAAAAKAASIAKEDIPDPNALKNYQAAGKGTAGPQSLVGKSMDWLKPNQTLSQVREGGFAPFKSGFTGQNLLTGGGGGLLAASLISGSDKKRKPWKDALIGSAGGAIASYLGSGGDLYKSSIGALAGGGGGLLSSLF